MPIGKKMVKMDAECTDGRITARRKGMEELILSRI
jgi:hypothetical protein